MKYRYSELTSRAIKFDSGSNLQCAILEPYS